MLPWQIAKKFVNFTRMGDATKKMANADFNIPKAAESSINLAKKWTTQKDAQTFVACLQQIVPGCHNNLKNNFSHTRNNWLDTIFRA